MAKQIKIPYEGTEYTLEFTRRSVETLERKGFKISEVSEKPMTSLPTLFAGAFLAHHRFVKPEIIDSIFSKLKNKDELIGKLAEMYNEPIISMFDEPEEDEGNLDWGASW